MEWVPAPSLSVETRFDNSTKQSFRRFYPKYKAALLPEPQQIEKFIFWIFHEPNHSVRPPAKKTSCLHLTCKHTWDGSRATISTAPTFLHLHNRCRVALLTDEVWAHSRLLAVWESLILSEWEARLVQAFRTDEVLLPRRSQETDCDVREGWRSTATDSRLCRDVHKQTTRTLRWRSRASHRSASRTKGILRRGGEELRSSDGIWKDPCGSRRRRWRRWFVSPARPTGWQVSLAPPGPSVRSPEGKEMWTLTRFVSPPSEVSAVISLPPPL